MFGVPPGNHFKAFLDSVYNGKPLKIVETGCVRDLAVKAEYGDGWSTLWIARWIREHKDCEFHTVDINPAAIEIAHMALEAENLAKFCTLHIQDSIKFLSNLTWADIFFLDSCDGLEHGLQEWRLAASAGASLIIMDDFQSKVAFAWNEAKRLGWKTEQVDRYSLFRRAS